MAKLRIAVRRFGPFESAIAAQFADFARSYGVEAELETVPMDLNPLHESVIGQRGLATGAWDIAFLNTDWLAEAVADNLLEDLTPHMARAPIADFPDAWSPSLTGLQRFDGGFWAMPYHDGPECLIYRRDLIAEPPATWEEFHALARQHHDPASGRYGTVLALFPDGHNSFYDFCIQIWSRGGEVFDGAGRPDFTSPAAHAALDFLRMLATDQDAIAPDCRSLDSVQSGSLFAEGKVALMANWFGFAAHADTAADSRVRNTFGQPPRDAADFAAQAVREEQWKFIDPRRPTESRILEILLPVYVDGYQVKWGTVRVGISLENVDQEIAALTHYLCSDEAAFVTGTDYAFDGGLIRLSTS